MGGRPRSEGRGERDRETREGDEGVVEEGLAGWLAGCWLLATRDSHETQQPDRQPTPLGRTPTAAMEG